MKFKKGQIYEGEYTNIFVIMVVGNEVHFIDGTSPSAIHEIQKIEPQRLEEYINKYGYKRADPEYEAFVDC